MKFTILFVNWDHYLNCISYLQGGQFMITFVDYYVTSFIAFLPAAFEMIAVAWSYGMYFFCSYYLRFTFVIIPNEIEVILGLGNFLNDVEFMLKRRLSMFWRVCWSILTPGIILVIFIYTFANLELLKYNKNFYPYAVYGKLLKVNERLRKFFLFIKT